MHVVSEREAAHLPWDRSGRFRLRVPAHWCAPVAINPHAAAAARDVLDWFAGLGCAPAELRRAGAFDVAGYVGMPFPTLPPRATVDTARYLSLWLLWDDVCVESLVDRWRIEPAHLAADEPPAHLHRFDRGWWELFRGIAARRSPAFVARLCASMAAWNDAAVEEARVMRVGQEGGPLPSFQRRLELRVATIGMYATIDLLEDLHDVELPDAFHREPAVARLKWLSNLLVGLGNDLFGCGKDFAEGQVNLVSALMAEEGLSAGDALARLVRDHDAAVEEFDELAATLLSSGPWGGPAVARWLQDVRFASLGFSRWEAQAPRYRAHRVVSDGRVVVPGFEILPAGGGVGADVAGGRAEHVVAP